ncbi:DUF456 domain-containing protein [Chryseolinea lacunae]|uniref:DUF456 domain-containing protein n=1 Tax=Chryseolinea lacunae TaxID=2801331 RepID=A0ABS1KKX1_9BACT|nr:DUF456 domain-containing protein [Chryseolinea lacunae]MBL0740111.1 DUF456 domain-containing protein [Chryseolinea lacunae]
MDIALIVIGVVLMLVGLAGCVLPFLPGPPLAFLGLLIQQLNTNPPFSAKFLWIMGGITVAITVLDYFVPIYGAKKFGGGKWGMWGCTIGLLVGLWFGPIGIIAGPFVGAFIGELLANNNSKQAFKSALGSFVGFLFGTLLKLVVCLVMAWYLGVFVYQFIVR